MEMVDERYSIKEVSEIIGFKPHVIRYYEKEFNLDIPRTSSNRRYFTSKETAQFQYIKKLQEKGLTNKQIKDIFKSSKSKDVVECHVDEIVENGLVISDEIISATSKSVNNNETPLKDDISNSLNHAISLIKEFDYKTDIEELSLKIDDLKNQLVNQEKDILICENAKLKMKIKERSYEVAELKDKLKREQHKKISIFSKLFANK